MSANGNGLPNDLTGKQRAFVDAYLANGFNATDAARQAGYAGDDNALAVRGSETVRNSKVRAVIDARLEARTLTAEEAIAKLDRIARFDISNYLDTEGRLTGLKLQQMIDDGYGDLVRGVKQTQYGTTIEWSSPDDALDKILKAHGAYINRTDVTSGGKPIQPILRIEENRPDDSND